MRELKISVCFIKQGEQYLLQLRSHDPNIGAAGLIAGFGGKIEPGETAIEAAVRETYEETSLNPNADDLIFIGNVESISDYQQSEVKIFAAIFLTIIDEKEVVVAKEGTLLCMTEEQVLNNFHRLSPASRDGFEIMLKQRK